MKHNAMERVAKLLRVLVYIALAVNVICLPFVPYFTLMLLFVGKETQVSYWLMIELYFWVCGGCTAVILWQAKRILNTILARNPFQSANAKSMNRAATACWVISAASVVRFVVELLMFWDPVYLFSYNTIFIPAFFMAGLLFKVMGALFRQASELQEEQNLTI